MFTSCKVVGVTASAVIRVILLRPRKVRLLTYFFNLEDFINALTHIYLLSLARNQPHPSLFLLFFVHLRGRGLVLFSLPGCFARSCRAIFRPNDRAEKIKGTLLVVLFDVRYGLGWQYRLSQALPGNRLVEMLQITRILDGGYEGRW